jgi:tetratricopeptide (TPR) repeat protein
MNKLAFIITILFVSMTLGTYAQTESTTGTAESNFAIYKKKVKKSEEQLTDVKSTASAKFWLSRAELMSNVFNLNREFLQIGRDKLHVNLFYPNPKSKKEWQDAEGIPYEELTYDFIVITLKNGVVDKFVETEILYNDPLPEALRCLEKAQELDVEGKLNKKIKEQYDLLKKDFERLAIEKFFIPDYTAAYTAFSEVDIINQKPIMEGVVDTTLLYYAGMSASRADLMDESILYYEKAIQNDFKEAEIYVFLKQKYFTIGDTAKGVETLEKGFKRFPDNQAVLIELINYYLLAGKGENALEYLKIAQDEDPENLSFIFAEATLYDKLGEPEKAKDTYMRCIEKDPNYFNAYYNLGVMYYNKAVEMYKAAETIKTPKEYGVAKDAADEVLKQALPYIEKAHEIDPAERSTLETLKTLYYRTQMTDKYNEVKALLDSMPVPAEKTGMESN